MRINNNSKNGGSGQFGETSLTKVFVGGLAWETPKDALRAHFQKYGQILEAVIISDKLTGRSKGYGFVTFKEAEAAKKACEEPCVIINGRRANCNLASLGARRSPPPPSNQLVQWYYPVPIGTPTPPSPFHPLPFYGYTPTYITADMNHNYNYNEKVSYGSGVNIGHNHHHAIHVGGNTMMPAAMYRPLYRTQPMGVPAPHFFHPTILPPHFAPSILPTPTPTPTTVGTGECFKRVV